MNHFAVVLVLIFSFFSGLLYAQNPIIENAINDISGNSIFTYIADLQEMNRVSQPDAQTEDLSASIYLLDKLAIMKNNGGIDSIMVHHYQDTFHNPNIVAVKEGCLHPDSVLLIGAHYDAAVAFAGADDNASGVGALLEILYAIENIEPTKTIYFTFFTAEEAGLIGSTAFANSPSVGNLDIESVMSLDGIAHKAAVSDDFTVIINDSNDANSSNLANSIRDASSIYVTDLNQFLLSELSSLEQAFLQDAVSDHTPFQNNSIPGVHIIEGLGAEQLSNYHTAGDTIGFGPNNSANSPDLVEKIAKICAAYLLETAGVCNTTSAIDFDDSDSIFTVEIHPNPISNELNIICESNDVYFEIYAPSGKKLLTTSEKTINLDEYPQGVYFLRAINKARTLYRTIKFFKT
ncbi:MAG: M20/M25/M40 family metallo-hydrolase [Chitinophagales bacterium]|nr:M20/M25/M40 family metallo-hydrolase [Chitinophagales bacterium]